MKTRLLTILLTLLPLMAWGQSTNAELYDGDLFTAETIEGVTLTYKVISAANKTCQVGGGEYNVKACDVNTTGTVTVPEVAKGFQVITVGGYAFSDCSKLTQINLPETIKTITYRAFSNCSGLTSFTIPNSVTRFDGNHQWNGCTGLTSIHIPANVTSMGNHTFANCPNILEVTVDENNPVFESPAGSHAIINKGKKSVVQGFKNTFIPEGITYIESAAFVGNEYNDIVLPKSFEGFYWDAFQDNAVHSITVAEGNTLFDSRNNCNALMETATDKLVKGCANTVIPANTKIIGEWAFAYSDFDSNDYPSLKTVVLPEGMTKIENWAFANCKDLEEVTIPSTVTEIMNNAFVRSDNMKTIVSYIQEPFALGNYVFDDTQCQNIILYVPQGTKSLYEAAEGWNQIKNIREIGSSNAEPYAVLSENNTVLTFYYDGNKADRNGMFKNGSLPGWYDQRESITKAVFDDSFANCLTLTSTSIWFEGCSKLTSIIGIENLKTDNVTDMYRMFYGCSGLTSLDVSHFNTQNVTCMDGMFSGCSSLTSLDLSSFNTQNVTTMRHMFYYCSSLTSLDLSNFNTQNVTDMWNMFCNCSDLTSLDVSGFKTDNVTRMSEMFYNCSRLTSLDLTSFKTANVTNMSSMFGGCSGLMSLDLSHFNTENVTNMNAMFIYCSGLSSLDLSSFKTDNVTDMSFMLLGCSGLTNLDVSFNTENVTNMNGMFMNCSNLSSLDVSSFKTDNVTTMGSMFYYCSGLTTIYVGEGWSTANVEFGDAMFSGCANLVGGKGTTYDDNHRDYTYAHIDGGPNNPGYFTDKDAVAAPTFRFEGDNLVIETATKDASIFYQMADLPNTDEATIEKIKESLTVTADAQQSIYYEQPIELKKSVVLKAIAAGAKNSEVSTLVYDYDVWQKLLEAINYGMEVSSRASDNSNVPDDMKEQLTHMLEEGKWVYDERMWESQAVNSLTNEIMQLAHQIDEMMTVVTEPEPYAVLSENNTVLTFYYDEKKEERNGMSVGPFSSSYDSNLREIITDSGWFAQRKSITTAIFDASFANCTTLTSTAYWFFNCSKLTNIEGISNLKTDNVTDMQFMFRGCSNTGFMSLDVSGFKTNNVTNMSGMFGFCYYLMDLDVSGFNTANVTDMSDMFLGCINLKSLDISGFNTANVTNMSGLFSEVGVNLDLSNLNTANVTDMSRMFNNCRFLKSIDLGSFKTENVTNMNSMFDGCSELTSLDLSGFNTANVTNMQSMFSNCSNLTNLNLAGFKTDNVTVMSNMFYGCTSLKDLDVSSFKTDNVTHMNGMFYGCSGLTSLDVSGFNTTNVKKTYNMFRDCSGLTRLDVSGFNTEKVDEISGMFQGCSGLTNLDVSGFKIGFTQASGYKSMFQGCSGLTSLDVSGYKASYVQDMSFMFDGCTSLKTIYVGGDWSTENVSSGENMFKNCSSLVGGMGTVYDENHVDHTYAHIDGGPNNPGYFTDKNAPIEPEPYAVLSENNTVLTFYYDEKKEERNGMSVGTFEIATERGWFEEPVTSVVFDASFADCSTITSTRSWFYGLLKLSSISGLQYLNTENVTDMNYMFGDCSALTSLDVTGFNTQNVTDMGGMFWNCKGLKKLDVSGFKTENVTNMGAMFMGCSGLLSLDVSHFNTEKVTNMNAMFFGCSGLKTIYVGEGWNTSAVTESDYMFTNCTSLVGGKGTTYDENHTDYTYAHIDEGPSNPGYFTRSGDAPYVAPDYTFDNNGVLTVGGSTSLADALSAAGGRAEVAKTITAIVWNSTATLTNDELQGLDNPNMLIYVTDATFAPANRDNVVIGDFAKNIVLTDVENGNNNFYCPQAFTAEMISYTRNFQQQTEIGVSRGWESIALPFTVQTMMHEKNGLIAPFGNDASGKHFWLRQLTEEGLARATTIEANTPYIISMPNNSEYPAEFNQAGRVTFSSQNAIVPVTSGDIASRLDPVTNTMIVFYPAMQRVGQNEEIYALNVGSAQAGYAEGSVFVAGLRDVRPFECYTWHHAHGPAPHFIPVDEMNGGATGIDSLTPNPSPKGEGSYYSLDGRKLQKKPTQNGVYILNGRRVVIK